MCIFAYGQTGSGKTYTMLGNEENRGIIPRAIQQVFASSRQLATQGWAFNMQVGAVRWGGVVGGVQQVGRRGRGECKRLR